VNEQERDKYLMKVIFGISNIEEMKWTDFYPTCVHYRYPYLHNYYKKCLHFSNWVGFGILWEWSMKQRWFSKFVANNFFDLTSGINNTILFINPDLFANTVYMFLKEYRTCNNCGLAGEGTCNNCAGQNYGHATEITGKGTCDNWCDHKLCDKTCDNCIRRY